MFSRFFSWGTIIAANMMLLHGQSTDQIRASYRGGGDASRGKCTIDLVVDGAADVEVRGDTAYAHNLSGRPPRFRRFECTSPIPPRANLRFDPQEGRGRQTLIRDPRDGGPLVVRIEDPQGGSEGYKFDFYWDGAARPGYAGGGYVPWQDLDNYHRDRSGWYQGNDWRPRIFERVREDVRHVFDSFQSDDDRRRLYRVIQELNEMQDKLANGRYDEGELNDVIEALQRVTRENRLSRRDRDVLSDDLERLRDFRSRHNDYGARQPY
jgi:hypothetical protein